MARKPIAYVQNINGCHHHPGVSMTVPLGGTAPLYDEDQIAYFSKKPAFKILSVKDLKHGAPPVETPEPEIATFDPGGGVPTAATVGKAQAGPDTPADPLSHVILHEFGADDDPKEAKVQLADKKIVTLKQAVSLAGKRGDAQIAGGWITLFPGEDFEIKARGLGVIVEELKKDPALFMRPDPDAKV